MTGILFCVGVTDELAVRNRAAGPGNLAVFARLYLGVDSDWALATTPSGLVKDAWELA